MSHECELTTRSYECDINGHVNNAVYLNYLEYARVSFLKDIGIAYGSLRLKGFGLVVTRISIDYKLALRAEDRVRIVTEPRKLGRASCTFSQKIYRDGVLAADAEVTWATVDLQGRPIRLPPELNVAEFRP
jgi:YbgC/YbaW family acyl-CoA thioester hydrolase